MSDGKLIFDTGIETSGFEKDAGKLEQTAEKTTKSVGDSLKNMGSTGGSVGNIMKGMLGADMLKKVGAETLEFVKESVALASDLQEVQNVVDVTFGDGAEKINAWSKNARSQFGLTELQAKQFNGTMGAMLKSMGLGDSEVLGMSQSITGLAADMASFYNLDHDTAFEKIRSGISGETEPLKQLGINMSVANLEAYALAQGITKSYDKMSQSEQVMLRYNYLMKSTADAQGDFARTSDSYANAVRLFDTNVDTLKASLGEALLPVLSNIVGGLNNMFDAMTPEKNLTQTIDDLNSTFEDTQAAIEMNDVRASALMDTLAELEQKESLTAQEASTWNAALKRLTEIYPGLSSMIDTNTGKINGGVTALREETSALKANAIEKAKVQALQGTLDAYAAAVVKQGELQIAVNENFAAYGEKQRLRLEAEASFAKEYGITLGNLFSGFDALSLIDTTTMSREQYAALHQTLEAYDMLRAEENALNQTTWDNKVALEAQTEQVKANAESVGSATKNLDGLNTTLDGTSSGLKGVASDTERVIIAGIDMTEMLKTAGMTADQGKEKFNSYANVALNMFERISTKSPVSVNRMIKNLQANTKTLEAWRENLKTLGDKLPADLLGSLEAQGPEAMAGAIQALAKASPKQLEALKKAWNEGGEAAKAAMLEALGVTPADKTGAEGTESTGPMTEAATADTDGAVQAYTTGAAEIKTARDTAMGVITGEGGEGEGGTETGTEGGESNAGLAGIVAAEMEAAVGAVESGAAPLGQAFSDALRSGLALGRGQVGNARSLGKAIVDGIAAGARSGSSGLSSTLASIVRSAVAAAKRTAEVNSPSKLFAREVGSPIAEGMAFGVEKESYQLLAAVDSAVRSAAVGQGGITVSTYTGLGASIPQAAAAGATSAYSQTVNFYSTMQAPDEITRAMRKQARNGLAGDRI